MTTSTPPEDTFTTSINAAVIASIGTVPVLIRSVTVILWTWFLKEFHIVYACFSGGFFTKNKGSLQRRLIPTPRTYRNTSTSTGNAVVTADIGTVPMKITQSVPVIPIACFYNLCFIVYVRMFWRSFLQKSLICESFAFPIKKWRNPSNIWCQNPHLRNHLRHLRQHLHPYYTVLPFHPYDDVSVSWFVDLCQQVLAYHERPTQKGQSGGHHKLS